MTSLTDHPVFADLRADTGQLVGVLQELVRCHPIYGSPGQEQALSIAARHLAASGLDVRCSQVDFDLLRRSPHFVDCSAFGEGFGGYGQVPRPSVHGRATFGQDGPHVILNGHVDVEFVTAPNAWSEPGLWSSGTIRDGRIYGRGTSDMLAGVACYLHTLRCLSRHFGDARGSVSVQLVLDEEIGGNGTLWELLTPRGPTPDLAIIAEPSDHVVCVATRSFHQFAIVCAGSPVHLAFADEYDNANRALPDVIGLLEDLNRWVSDQVPAGDGRRFVMYGLVRGGSDAAVPAEELEIGVTLALPAHLDPVAVRARLEGRLADLARGRLRGLRTQAYGVSFPGSASADDGPARLVLDAGRSVGATLRAGEFPSACDARLFAAFGIPVVVYGPGSLARAHGSDEFVTVDELTEYCAVLASTLLRLWGIT